MKENVLIESMLRYVGQTVTIFTESGGLSGSGFTGILAGVSCDTVKLITDIGAPPSCPVGSSCDCGHRRCCMPRKRFNCCENFLGSVTEIPICKIVSFVHNAI